MAQAAVQERIGTMIQKFADLGESKIQVTLEMENSPHQSGPDFFKVKIQLSRGRYDGVIIEKADSNLYTALATITDHMLEKLNRFGDRTRVKERVTARKISEKSRTVSGA
jgi:ribosome-associated translation inhibitor RaiA